MYKKSVILTIIVIIIIYVFTKITKKQENFYNIENLYTPSNDTSVWKERYNNKIEIANEDRFYTIKKVMPVTPSPPECMCPKCSECVCPSCPSEKDILRKYGYLGPIRYENKFPILSSRISQQASHYQLVGYLHKLGVADDRDKYKILPVFGKEYRGGFFKYYTQFISGDQPFRKMIFKPPSSNRDYSREIYEGDIINIDSPINARFEFKEEKLDNRIDLFDEDPF